MEEAQTIEALWRDHFAAPFPRSCRGLEVGEVDFPYLDSLAAGCIDTYVQQGTLDAARLDLLRDCLARLPAFRESAAVEAVGYVTRLERLAALIVEAASRPGPRNGS